MIIKDDRTELDNAIKDIKITLLLLFGTNTTAENIHKTASDSISEPWRKTFLIENISILSEKEKAEWYKDDYSFTTLSKNKIVVEKNNIDLLCNSGNPSIRKIKSIFAKADLA